MRMSFKQEWASPKGGQLATEIIIFHHTNQVTPTVVSSVIAIFWVIVSVGFG